MLIHGQSPTYNEYTSELFSICTPKKAFSFTISSSFHPIVAKSLFILLGTCYLSLFHPLSLPPPTHLFFPPNARLSVFLGKSTSQDFTSFMSHAAALLTCCWCVPCIQAKTFLSKSNFSETDYLFCHNDLPFFSCAALSVSSLSSHPHGINCFWAYLDRKGFCSLINSLTSARSSGSLMLPAYREISFISQW